MAKQAAGTHQPLSYRAHVRLRALHKNLHSRFQAVRAAAAKEIQAILNKKRGIQNRLRELAVKTARATVRKVTPSQLHKPLRVQERAAQAPKRGQATPIRAHMPKGGFTPLTDHTLTRAELRQRTRDAKAAAKAARGGPGQPLLVRPREVPLRQGQHEPVMPAHLTDDAIQQRWQGAWDGGVREGRERAQQRQNGQRQPDAMQQATETMRKAHQQQPSAARSSQRTGDAADKARTHRTEAQRARTEHDFAEAQEHERRAEAAERKAAASPVPSLPGHPEAVQRAAQDHEKGRWAGLRKRTGDAPERTRSSRTRTRNPA